MNWVINDGDDGSMIESTGEKQRLVLFEAHD